MDLGDFEITLNVKDIGRSLAFYQALGFQVIHDEREHGIARVRNGACRIALYQGYGEEPLLLNFREGDVEAIAKRVQARGLAFETPPFTGDDGGVGALIRDPDGNGIYLCRHVAPPDAAGQAASG